MTWDGLNRRATVVLAGILFAVCVVYAWRSTASPPTPACCYLPLPDPATAHPIEELGERWPSHPCPSISPMMATNMGCDQ